MNENALDVDQLIACAKCDALATKPTLSQGQKAYCGRCGSRLFSCKKNAVNRTFAVSIAGLLMVFPAMLLPIIGIDLVGQYNEASMVDCIAILVDNNYFVHALCVFLFTFTIPIVRLITTFYITYSIKRNKVTAKHIQFFSSYHSLDHWVMLNIFILASIVSMYKIIIMADLHIEIGLFALLFLLLCSSLISFTLDQTAIWETLEKAVAKQNS